MSVDLNDFTYRIYDNGGKRKLFRHYCDKCGADRGYILYSIKGESAKRPCKQCRNEVVAVHNRGKPAWNRGVPQTEETKEKLSKVLTGRKYPDKGKPMSMESRIKLSCNNRGINIEDFDGFSTPAEEKARSKLKSQKLHIQCFEKYDYTCQKCGDRGCHLNAHHIFSWKTHPELRYELSNLICLCHKCHKAFHKIYGSSKGSNNQDQMDEFLREEICQKIQKVGSLD